MWVTYEPQVQVQEPLLLGTHFLLQLLLQLLQLPDVFTPLSLGGRTRWTRAAADVAVLLSCSAQLISCSSAP